MQKRILSVAIVVLAVLFSFIFFRVLIPLKIWPGVFWPATVTLILAQAVLLWVPFFFWTSTSEVTHPYERFLERFAHLSMGVLSILLFLAVIRDLSLLPFAIFGKASHLEGPLASLFLLSITFTLSGAASYFAWRGPVLRKISLAPPSTESPLRIVQVSDLHVGTWIGKRYVERLARQIESLGPIDLFILTGDIGDGDPHAHIADLEPLKRINAKIGKYSVSGNHEGYWNEAEWNTRIRELGFRVLENEGEKISTPLGPLTIHGVSDSRSSPERAFAILEPEVYSIFLAHQPKHAASAIKVGARLQLSGHTHGGQFLPWSLFIGFVHRHAAGLYHVEKTAIYVNSGTGFWGPPFRLGTRSETTLIEFDPRH